MSQPIAEILEKLNRGESFTFERTFTVDREAMDEESRTVNVAFASGDPIDHWFGKLCLSMTKKAMRSERLKSGAPLLMDHRSWDWQAQVGVIERFEIGDDDVARADVRFSKSARGEEVFQDVKDGIRQQISVGFLVHEMHLESSNKDKKKGDVYRSDDWEPYEISIVSVAADYKKAGVGRSAQFLPVSTGIHSPTERDISRSKEETKMTPEEIAAAAAAGEAARSVETVTRTAEQVAADEIREWGRTFGDEAAATNYIRANVTEDGKFTGTKAGFFASVRAAQPPAPVVPVMDPQTAAARNGAPQVRLARNISRHSAVTSFTGENKEERAYRFGQWLLGRALYDDKFAPCHTARKFCDENGLGLERAMSEGVNETGGYTVPPEFSNDLIDLREQYGVFRRNAKIRPMTRDTLTIPRRVSGLTASFIAEAAAMSTSDKGWDQVELVAKKLYAFARYSSEVNEDSIIDFANDLASEIAYAFAEKEDQCGFNGTGTSTYGGMTGVCQRLLDVYTTAGGVGLKLGSGNAYSELLLTDFEAVVGSLPQYADSDSAAWYVHRQFYWNVMVKVMLASGGVTAAEIEDARKQRFMGYRVEFSQVLPKTEANSQVCALFGDLSKAASFGTRRDTSIMLSEHSRFANDQIEIRGTERFDINVHDVGDTSNAGPIVGLLTAGS